MKKFGILFLFLCFFSGCGVNPIEIIVDGVIRWVEGEAHKYYNVDTPTLYRAVKRACHDLDYEIKKDKPSGSEFYLIAGNNDRFKIKIKRIEENISRLSVRVNFMGDKPYAELLYKKVDEELSTIEFDNGHPVRR